MAIAIPCWPSLSSDWRIAVILWSFHCCHVTQLLGDGLVARPSLLQVHNLVSDLLGKVFVLGRGAAWFIYTVVFILFALHGFVNLCAQK